MSTIFSESEAGFRIHGANYSTFWRQIRLKAISNIGSKLKNVYYCVHVMLAIKYKMLI